MTSFLYEDEREAGLSDVDMAAFPTTLFLSFRSFFLSLQLHYSIIPLYFSFHTFPFFSVYKG